MRYKAGKTNIILSILLRLLRLSIVIKVKYYLKNQKQRNLRLKNKVALIFTAEKVSVYLVILIKLNNFFKQRLLQGYLDNFC